MLDYLHYGKNLTADLWMLILMSLGKSVFDQGNGLVLLTTRQSQASSVCIWLEDKAGHCPCTFAVE